MRWLLLDEVVTIQKKKVARTRSRIPSGWASAELLMMEMMAQTGALLLGAEKNFEDDVIFAKIEQARFDHGWKAGETIEIEATSENLRPEGAWLEASIQNQKRNVAQSRFLLMNVGRLIPNEKTPITFHRAFMEHFKIRDKVR